MLSFLEDLEGARGVRTYMRLHAALRYDDDIYREGTPLLGVLDILFLAMRRG